MRISTGFLLAAIVGTLAWAQVAHYRCNALEGQIQVIMETEK